MESNLIRMFTANPELMGKLMMGQTVDLGDGLTVKMLRHSFFKWEDKIEDALEFEFFLEGKSVGTLDQDFGGWIGYHESLDRTQEEDDRNWELMEKITNRWVELFRSYAEQVLILN
jgi:hypothetical protein